MKNLILLLTVFFFPAFSAISKQTFKLSPNLRGDYLALLDQAADFHNVIAKGDTKAIQTEIKETQEIIAKLYRQILSVPQFHHRIHSHKLLKSIEVQLAVMHSNNFTGQSGEKKNIKKLFNSFFELVQVYDLAKDMKDKVFYCSRDKSLWFQTSGKAKNPISLNHRNCGRPVL